MRLPRITTRQLMLAIVGIALAMGLSLPALDVLDHKDYHSHAYVRMLDGKPVKSWEMVVEAPFWPRYWRRVVGLDWKEQPLCGRGSGKLAEACEFAHPEISVSLGGGVTRFESTAEMDVAFEELKATMSRDLNQ